MSKQITVSYEGITLQIKAQCETAVHSLCKIDKVLDRIHETASHLETEKVKRYETFLMTAKTKIKSEIENFQKTLDQYRGMREVGMTSHDPRYSAFIRTKQQLESESANLTRLVNDLTGAKLEVIDQMIDEGLLNEGRAAVEKLQAKSLGVLSIDSSIMAKINSIDDVSLRELTYHQLLIDENKNITFEKLLFLAQQQYDLLLGKKAVKIVQSYQEELRANGLNQKSLETIDSANITKASIDALNAVVTSAINDEKVRKETLKVIIKAIQERGFIVDTKKNLKFDKDRNIVKLVALKASGQIAEFEIQLNGKFMYHFDEYEGQACQKDIAPFLEDLKNVYDINILHEQVEWENPDKIQTKKYQYANHNKGTN